MENVRKFITKIKAISKIISSTFFFFFLFPFFSPLPPANIQIFNSKGVKTKK